MKKQIKVMTLAIIALTLVACGKEQAENKSDKNSEKLSIVTSFYPMYDFTKNITQDKADVTMLIDGGVEPHDFEPSAKDMAKIQNADVFVYNSNELETWVESVLKNIDTSKVKVIEASEGITLLEGTHSHDEDEEDHEEDHDGADEHSHIYDPHVWLDPVLAKEEVETISHAIIDLDKTNADYYAKNTADYTKKLNDLNEAFTSGLKDAKNRKFVTQHTAFSYLANQYKLEQVAISGISPDQEPTPKELKEIEDFVTSEKIEVIYTESSASPKIAKTISDATGAKLEVLNPLESLSKEEQDAGEDYISTMTKNLEALKLSIK